MDFLGIESINLELFLDGIYMRPVLPQWVGNLFSPATRLAGFNFFFNLRVIFIPEVRT